MKKINKSERVIDCGLELLKDRGDHGLTMRQVALKAEMSLSNVQYYFKDKNELLTAIADRYFNECLEDIEKEPALVSGSRLKQELSEFLRTFLTHGLEVSEMCRIFREYWAIATRNETIEEYLSNYYRKLAGILADKLRSVSVSEEAVSSTVSVIIPFVEGYSITASSLPRNFDDMTDLLTNIVLDSLTEYTQECE